MQKGSPHRKTCFEIEAKTLGNDLRKSFFLIFTIII